MTSSKSPPRQVPPPPGSRAAAGSYSRFIPREELQGFANWTPGRLGEPAGAAAPPPPPPPSAEELAAAQQAELQSAHQAGYRDGYRDGLAALESFKQSFAQQTGAQVGALLAAFDDDLQALEEQLARSVVDVAVTLARQVVRSELVARPALVAQVAQDAVNAVLMSARHITVHVHPQDHALVAEGAAEALAARGARLLADASVAAGGCRVVSDVGTVDARIESRWAQAVAALGSERPWSGDEA